MEAERRPADLLILHGLLAALDPAGTVIDDGGLAVGGGRILAVGPADEVEARYTAPEVIDAAGQIVMPGLINTHTHAGMTLYRGLAEDLVLEPWLERLWKAEARFVRPETVDLGFRLAAAEMIRAGITTAVDMYWHPDVSARVARRMGFRLVTGPAYIDFEAPDRLPAAQRTAWGREYLQEFGKDPLLVPAVMPHSTYTVSPRYLEEARDLAEEFGVLFSTHASESEAEMRLVYERFGQSPPRHLDGLGLLGSRTILAHCVHLADDEMDLLAGRCALVAHCPASNLKLACGIARVPDMQRAGVRVALGTDGPVSSNDLNLWYVMRLAASLPKGVRKDAAVMPARAVVHMATLGAAEGLGLQERIGSLEAGKEADVILIDLRRPHLVPWYDIYPHLVYAVGPADVATVLIQGRVVMRDRELLTLDEAGALAETQALAGDIARYMSEV